MLCVPPLLILVFLGARLIFAVHHPAPTRFRSKIPRNNAVVVEKSASLFFLKNEAIFVQRNFKNMLFFFRFNFDFIRVFVQVQ